MKKSVLLVSALLSGTALSAIGSTPDMIMPDQNLTSRQAPVVEVHALSVEQARALAEMRAEYHQELEALQKAHGEKLDALLKGNVNTQSL